MYTRYDSNFVNVIVWGSTLAADASGWTAANPLWANAFNDSLQGTPVLAIAPDGAATAAWVRNGHAGNNIAQFATKALGASSWPQAPADDSVAGAGDLSLRTGNAGNPAIAVEPDGAVTVAYSQDWVLAERTRPAGTAGFSGATQISDAWTNPSGLSLIPSADGSTVALWDGQDGHGNQIVAAARRSAGSAGFVTLPNLPGTNNALPAGASDDQGNIATAWNDAGSGVVATGLVVGAPTISNVRFPTAVTQGGPFSYDATVTDRWVEPTSTWSFGDNTSGPLSGTKAYTGTGVFDAVLTATDPFGNAASVSRSVTVAAPAPVGGTAPASAVGPTATAASVTQLRQSHRIWRVGTHRATFAARHKAPVGTTFTFTLNVPATVQLSFTRPGAGRSAGGRCLRLSRLNRRRRRCALAVGRIIDAAHAGLNEVTFQGRLPGGKRLPAGAYTLVVSAIGSSAAPQTVKFTIAKG